MTYNYLKTLHVSNVFVVINKEHRITYCQTGLRIHYFSQNPLKKENNTIWTIKVETKIFTWLARSDPSINGNYQLYILYNLFSVNDFGYQALHNPIKRISHLSDHDENIS